MLDANLYTINFVRSTIEPDKLFLIEDSTGDPIYFRTKVPENNETRVELYHAPSLAPLGSFHHLSSKLKLISLANPSSTIELKNSGYITFEWSFYFDQLKLLKFCWRRDIIGLAGNKRGFTCWMSRKPDPDYPCAIYRPGSSSQPPSCQFLDFNIRRIENLKDPRGLELVIILSLLGFTEALADPEPRRSPPNSPPQSQPQLANTVPSKLSASVLDQPIEVNELRVGENSSTSELVAQALNLFEDPLFLYLFVHAPNPKAFKQATTVAEQIKRDRLKKSGEELYQYLMDDVMSQEMSGSRSGPSLSSSNTTSNSLKIYLSRTPLDELLPKASAKPTGSSNRSSTAMRNSFFATNTKKPSSKTSDSRAKPRVPPKESNSILPSSSSSSFSSNPTSTIHSRIMTGVHRRT